MILAAQKGIYYRLIRQNIVEEKRDMIGKHFYISESPVSGAGKKGNRANHQDRNRVEQLIEEAVRS